MNQGKLVFECSKHTFWKQRPLYPVKSANLVIKCLKKTMLG